MSDEQHYYTCAKCGRKVDMRDLAQVIGHEADPCLSDGALAEMDAQLGPITARRLGDPVEWRDGKPTNLN